MHASLHSRIGPMGAILLCIAWLSACTGHDPNPMVFAEDCQSCHLSEHRAATDPVHLDVYPDRCVACHSNDAWRPDDNSGHELIFPLSGTEHDGLDCAQCHPAPAAFLGFTCTDCHEHRQSEMDPEHSGISGYVYESRACLNCHPDGSE